MKKMVKTQTTEISNLPSELVCNILSRLPITFLLRSAKLTCKLWYSIIGNDPIFAELHFNQSLNTPGYLYTHSSSDNLLYFADNPTLALKHAEDIGCENMDSFIDSCRGLISYTRDPYSIYISNPILQDRIEIRLPTPSLPHRAGGLGYATLNKQYKYLHFSHPKRCSKGLFTIHAKIFTLGEESWRDLSVPRNYHWGKSVYCNGALYWILASGSPALEVNSEYRFMSFDLDTENFRIRRILPHDTKCICLLENGLAVFGETVAYITHTRNKTLQLWMLVDEAEDIWIEKYDFSPPTRHGCYGLPGFWMNQDLYGFESVITREPGNRGFKLLKRCLSYNVDHKTYTEVKLPFAENVHTNADGYDISHQLVLTHVGCLLSPSKIAKVDAIQSCVVIRGRTKCSKECSIKHSSCMKPYTRYMVMIMLVAIWVMLTVIQEKIALSGLDP